MGKPESSESVADYIRHWAKTGLICRVLGHPWYTDNYYLKGPDIPKGRSGKRTCPICGKTEYLYRETKEEWR